MTKFRKKPVEIEAITFDEFVEYGKQNTDNIVNGMPWSFEYKGYNITHANDKCYLIPTLEGTMNFSPDDVLITGIQGEIYPCKIEIFNETYEVVDKDVKDSYQQRVFDEASELAQKIDKLRDFLYSDKSETVKKEEQILLYQQLGHMSAYLRVLKERMDNFN